MQLSKKGEAFFLQDRRESRYTKKLIRNDITDNSDSNDMQSDGIFLKLRYVITITRRNKSSIKLVIIRYGE